MRLTRETALALARVAGYHNDTKRVTRLRVEARVSNATLNEAWAAGVRARLFGGKCDCRECQNLDTSKQVSRAECPEIGVAPK